MPIQCGVDAVPFGFPDGLGLAGYGPLAGEGYGDDEADPRTCPMARALVLDAPATSSSPACTLFIVVVDLMGSSLRVQQQVVDRLKAAGVPVDDAHLIILASHTHSAPGQFFGNSLYDAFAQSPGGYRADVADLIADTVSAACQRAYTSRRPSRVAVIPWVGWRIGRNRSLTAFESNFAPAERNGSWFARWTELLGLTEVHTGSDVFQRAVDPRLWTLWAFDLDSDAVLGTLAIAPFHNAALGRGHRLYDADWAGRAAHGMSARGIPWAAVAQGPAGDVTVIPSMRGMDAMGTELAEDVASSVVEVWLGAMDAAREAAREDPALAVGLFRWRPDEDGLDRWDLGQPVIGGSEESRSPWFSERRGEARKSLLPWDLIHRTFGVKNEQAPKESAFGLFQPAVRRLFSDLEPAPEHPLQLVRLGSHLFFVLPCEITGFAAARVAARLKAASASEGIETVSPLAIGNDYAGYLTTEAEYDCQRYEGAHNLFGRRSLAVVERHLESMVLPNGLRIDTRARRPHPPPLTAAEFQQRVVSVLQTLSAPLRAGAILKQGLGLVARGARKTNHGAR